MKPSGDMFLSSLTCPHKNECLKPCISISAARHMFVSRVGVAGRGGAGMGGGGGGARPPARQAGRQMRLRAAAGAGGGLPHTPEDVPEHNRPKWGSCKWSVHCAAWLRSGRAETATACNTPLLARLQGSELPPLTQTRLNAPAIMRIAKVAPYTQVRQCGLTSCVTRQWRPGTFSVHD